MHHFVTLVQYKVWWNYGHWISFKHKVQKLLHKDFWTAVFLSLKIMPMNVCIKYPFFNRIDLSNPRVLVIDFLGSIYLSKSLSGL